MAYVRTFRGLHPFLCLWLRLRFRRLVDLTGDERYAFAHKSGLIKFVGFASLFRAYVEVPAFGAMPFFFCLFVWATLPTNFDAVRNKRLSGAEVKSLCASLRMTCNLATCLSAWLSFMTGPFGTLRRKTGCLGHPPVARHARWLRIGTGRC